MSILKTAAIAGLLAAFLVVACAPTQTTKPMSDEQRKAELDAAQASYSIGQQYFAQGDLESALRNFGEALGHDSTFYEAHIAIGAVYRRQRDAVNAEASFRNAQRLDPKRPKAYEGLGDLYLSMSDLDKALSAYLSGLEQDSSLVELYNGAAEVYVKRNEMNKARDLYQAAMRRFPEDQNVQRLWADFLYKQKRFQEAADALVPVVAKFPKIVTLRQRLVDALIELKKYDIAVAHLDTVLQLDASDNQAMLRKGAVLMLQGKSRQAITVFEELVRRDSTKAEHYGYWGQALLQQGNTGAAESRLRRALSINPGYTQAYMDLGDIRRKAADSKRGTNLTATSTANLKGAKALYEEARSFYAKGTSDPAYADYARAQLDYIDKSVSGIDKELFVR